MSVGKNLRRKARYKRAKARAAQAVLTQQAVEREAKQIVSSDDDATTVSAETRAAKLTGVAPKIVQGGLPSQGKR